MTDEIVQGPWEPTPWKEDDPPYVPKVEVFSGESVDLGELVAKAEAGDLSSERIARIRHYWSKVRQALKQGNVTLAAEWLESASAAEGAETGQALRNLVGKLCRQEIER